MGSITDIYASQQEREEAEEAKKFAFQFASSIVRSRETLTQEQSEEMEALVRMLPDMAAWYLDAYFTREVVAAVPGYVERTLQLCPLAVSLHTPSSVTNTYVREATRTYIPGLPQASIALCRAALEQGLKERFGYQLTGTFVTFQDLLREARNYHLLDDLMERIARDVNNAADDVLHEKPTDLSTAREVLEKVRGVLQHIYSAEGHY